MSSSAFSDRHTHPPGVWPGYDAEYSTFSVVFSQKKR
jgi:hypothetical protein